MSPADPFKAAVAGVLLFVLGLGIAGSLLRLNQQDQERLRGWQRADGTVVELLERRSPDGDVIVPLIAFTTPSGDRVSFASATVRKGSPLTSPRRSRSCTDSRIRRRLSSTPRPAAGRGTRWRAEPRSS